MPAESSLVPAFPRAGLKPLLHVAVARLSGFGLVFAMILAGLTLKVGFRYAYLGHQNGFVDMAHDGYQLRQILDLSRGAVIFRDTFDQYGGLHGYLNTLGFFLFGRTLLGVKDSVVVWYGLIAIGMFVLARRWLGEVLSAFSVLIWLGVAPFYQHGVMISPHAYVLFFQLIATIVLVESSSTFEASAFAIAGAVAGLSFEMKQTMGTLYVGAVMVYLVAMLVRHAGQWKRLLAAGLSFAAGYAAVLCAMLAFLWSRGAVHDWYLQTIVFPRDYYIVTNDPWLFASSFVRLQIGQEAFWLVIRGVVLMAAVLQMFRREVKNDLVLMGCITAALWAGAYPSGNFMHQWWTASLSIPAFVMCVNALMIWMARGRTMVAAAASMLAVGALVEGGVSARLKMEDQRVGTLTKVLTEPPVLRGIQTDPLTFRVFQTFFETMTRYREHHPDVNVVSMNPGGPLRGMPVDQSLLFLDFLDNNRHASPVYWSLPVLSTTTYPQYLENLWKEIRATRPLIVEYREEGYKPNMPPGYMTLIGAQGDFGYWYLYAPEHADRVQHGELPIFLSRTEPAPAVAATKDGAAAAPAPAAAAPSITTTSVTAASDETELNPNPVGSWRGTQNESSGPVNLFTWPGDLPLPVAPGRIEAFVEEPIGRVPIVQRKGADAFIVDGSADSRFGYLLQYKEKALERGTILHVRGTLVEGGFQIGFLRNNQWCCTVTVTEPGPFDAVIRIQRRGLYELRGANDLDVDKWRVTKQHWIRGTLNLFTGTYMPNEFSVSKMEWVLPAR